MRGNRVVYLILIIIVMILGLLSRKLDNLPVIVSLYAGDILWALMVFLIVDFVFNNKSILFNISIAIIFSYGIEISQLYHAPWIDSIRNTTLGGLILGFGFLWSDLICYTIGIFIGGIIESIFKRINTKR